MLLLKLIIKIIIILSYNFSIYLVYGLRINIEMDVSLRSVNSGFNKFKLMVYRFIFEIFKGNL